MSDENRRVRIAEIIYCPDNEAWPWWTIRVGTVAEQGGLNFGSEESGHPSLEAALKYLQVLIESDKDILDAEIERRLPK
jgi:hypothetical protein